MNYILMDALQGNPGKAGAGAVIYKDDEEIWSDSLYVGHKHTNNYAEYKGLAMGLKKALNLNIPVLSVKGDSMLAIKQLNGQYKVKSKMLKPIYDECKQYLRQFKSIKLEHVYRHLNCRADQLANDALK